MKYTVLYHNDFKKSLKKIPNAYHNKIFKFLKELENDFFPENYDVKKLIDSESGKYRCRIGDYRILYLVKDLEVIIILLDILHRKDAYK